MIYLIQSSKYGFHHPSLTKLTQKYKEKLDRFHFKTNDKVNMSPIGGEAFNKENFKTLLSLSLSQTHILSKAIDLEKDWDMIFLDIGSKGFLSNCVKSIFY